MKRIFTLFVAIIVLALVGCASTPQIVTQTKYQVVVPSADLTAACSVTQPPDRTTFINEEQDARFTDLFKYSSSLLNDLNVCNKRWAALNQWFTDQQKAYSSH